MRIVASLVHLISGGLVLSLGWLAAAVFCLVFPATRPMAGACLQLAAFHLHPYGRAAVHERELKRFQEYLRTGRIALPSRIPLRPSEERIAQAALWAPFGVVLVSLHALHGLLTSVLFFSNPWRSPSFSLLGPAVLPGGWRVVAVDQACVRFAHPRRGQPRRDRQRFARPAFQPVRLARSLGATAGSAVLVLWASYSATGPLIRAMPPGGYRGPIEVVAVAQTQKPMPLSLYRFRPEANPPIPLGTPPVMLAEVAPGCAIARPLASDSRLARRHTDFSLPLGAAQIPSAPGVRPSAAVQQANKAQALAASRAYSKIAGDRCLADLAAKASRSASLAARKAEVERLARKADPDIILASLGPSPMVREEQRRHRFQMRNLDNIVRMAALISPAKAPESGRAGDAVDRVAKATALRVPTAAPEKLDDSSGTGMI